MVADPVKDYLTLSQLSPRKAELSKPHSVTPDSDGSQGTSHPVIDGTSPSSSLTASSERPVSPMRGSIKRAGSPVEFMLEAKRSKPAAGPSAPSSSQQPKPHKSVVQPSRPRKNVTAAASTSTTSARTRRVVSAAPSRADRARKPGGSSTRTRVLSTSVPGREADGATAKNKAPRPVDPSLSSHSAPSRGGSRSGQQLASSQKENAPEKDAYLTDAQKPGRPMSSTADRPVRPHFGVSTFAISSHPTLRIRLWPTVFRHLLGGAHAECRTPFVFL